MQHLVGHLWRLFNNIHCWWWLHSNNCIICLIRQCSLCCFLCWRWTALKILGVHGDHSSVRGSFSCYHASFLLNHRITNALKWCTELVLLLLTQETRITLSDGLRFCIIPLISIHLNFLLYQSVFLSHLRVFFTAKAELRDFAKHFSSMPQRVENMDVCQSQCVALTGTLVENQATTSTNCYLPLL